MEQTKNKLDTSIANEGKNTAMIAYITIIGLIIAFVMNNEKKNEFVRFHIKQSLGLVLTGLALGLVGMIPILGWLVYIVGIFVLLYLWIVGLMNAINSKEKTVPFLGDKYAEWFKNL
jgi:uncharacterized membrane protein